MGNSATTRALVLLATVLDVPGVASVVRKVTRRPETELIRIGDTAVTLIRPSGSGPWPAYVFVNGAHPERRREPVVERLTEGLARAGFLVIVPDPPGLAEGAITPTTLDGVIAVTRSAVQRPEVAGGRTAILGASTGASLALLAAADPELRGRISVVVAVTPYADLEKIVCLATTRIYEHDGESGSYAVNALFRDSVFRSMVAAVDDERDRRRLLELPTSPGEANLEAWRSCLPDLKPDAQAVVQLLLNDDPAQFGDLYRALPSDVRTTIRRLSPVSAAARVAAPVELVVPPKDVYFPHGEVLALAALLPSVQLTVTPTLDHTRPSASLKSLGAFLRFCRFVVRGLSAAEAKEKPRGLRSDERPRMRLPNAAHTSRPWRIHELTRDFRLEDVWALPGTGARDDFPRLVQGIASGDPSRSSSAAVRTLWAIRWKVGELLGWDRPAAGLGARVTTLRDRLPGDLRDAPTGPGFDALPFTPLYLLDDEWAAEIANRTMHGVLHIGLVPDETSGHRAQMAVLVKPNGLLGTAYMAAIRPFRHLIVYPAMLRQIEREWRARDDDPTRMNRDTP